jgi:uncharacterized membrane protein YjjP (DUF1212 family)
MTILEYFAAGALSGFLGYSWYIYSSGEDSRFVRALWGIFIASGLGGLFAVALDRNIAVSIVSGMTAFLTYTAIIKAAKEGSIITTIKDLLLKVLTSGGAK